MKGYLYYKEKKATEIKSLIIIQKQTDQYNRIDPRNRFKYISKFNIRK